MNSKLLFDSPPVVFSMELAVAVGVTEAIVLQQIHYWCDHNAKSNRNRHDNHYWCYNSMSKWLEKYPCFTRSTLTRAFDKLRKRGILITGNYNKNPMDRTLWYRIDYDALEALMSAPFTQNEEMDLQVLSEPIPENNQRIQNDAFPPEPVKSICDFSIECDAGEKLSLDVFIDWYYAAYRETFKRDHPIISSAQRQRIVEELTTFLSEPAFLGVSFEGLQEMTKEFFRSVDSNDWRINHFATYGILVNRYHAVY